MTAKKYAQELVNLYMDIKNQKLSDYSKIYLPTAKECARIAVGVALSEHVMNDSEYSKRRFAFFKKVIEEIDNI